MKESAVSPVVGVMLMLIVTVILAAVFAAVSGAIFSSGNTNPVQAEIVFGEIDGDGNYIFELKSGDAFSLSQIKLVYGLRENNSAHDTKTFSESDGSVTLDNCRFSAPGPEFSPAAGNHLTYSFYDIKSGTLVSAGEILIL
ncbi:MAG TPA: type IV pilin N-terminal domain-containing protein [Methanocorpusculum sp.]|nr:type IV pilin N-terminal domain-containing protein [Methanocorpusculum sp.]